MRRRNWAVIAASLWIVLAEPALCQSWQDWQTRGKALLEASQMGQACDAFRHALLEAGHARVSPEELMNLHSSLASAYALSGRYAEATSEFRRTLDMERTLHGQDSLEYAMVYGSLSMLPTRTEDRDRGIALLKESIAENPEAKERTELVSAKDCLAKLLYQEERLSEAESVLEEARASAASDLTQPIWIRAELLNDLGAVRELSGRPSFRFYGL